MKKILIVLLSAALVCTFFACSNSKKEVVTQTTTEPVITSVTVSVSNPDKETEDLTEDEQDSGFISKTVDTDNSTVTYTISETNLNKYLKKLAKSVTNCRKVLINDKNIKGILTVACSEHYSKAVVTVTDEFKTKNIDTVKSTYLKAMKEYQKWSGNEGSTCTVSIVDENGKEVKG